MKIFRARAPLRLGIAGGGTDVPPFCEEHGGVVLNATLNMYAYAVLEPSEDGLIEFVTTDRQEIYCCEAIPHLKTDGELELQLHKGVYNRIVRDFNGGAPLSVKLTTFSDAKAGSGLGTSSTMVVAIIKVFVEWLNLPLGDYDIAHLACEVERNDLGLIGGKQDQYAATFGGFNFMEFYGSDRVIVNPLRIKSWVISELESSLILYFTGVTRDSAKVIEDQIKNVGNHQRKALQALKVIKEDAYHMKESLLKGNIREFGEFLDKSWQEKKRVSCSVSNSMIDGKYNIAKDAGAYAGKVSGAGGGGFMMFMVDPVKRMDVVRALADSGGVVMNCHFTKMGTQSWRMKQ